MNIKTNCTDRKAMAHALAAHLGTTAEYLRTPTYAFRVGSLQVERDGSITGERADLEAAAGWLMENGYIQEPIPAEEASEAEQPTAEEPAEEEPAEEEPAGEQPVEEPETAAEPDADSNTPDDAPITHTSVSMPLTEFTPHTLINLVRMLYSRQCLIREMIRSEDIVIAPEVITTLQSDALTEMPILERVLRESIEHGFIKGVDLEDDRIGLVFPATPDDPTRWQHYAKLLMAIADKAKAATRVNTALIEPVDTEMKYCCRAFLLQLGLGGAQHKELRGVLLNHLHGFAAFRTAEKMDAHKQKYAELRRQTREQNSEAHEEGDAE